ncbi:MAG: YgjP-like metallopeptidase domain-containing protein [Parcubacteria group bacterium]
MAINRRIKINNKEISYTLKRKRGARSVRLAIYASGAFVVTAPKWYPVYVINKFLAEKAEWIYNKLKHIDFAELDLKRETEKINYQAQKEAARRIIQARLKFFNQHYNFAYNRISVKNQKSCWGSASRQGNLNFNYKVASLPEDLRDYIIVHELCHLGELNHSRKFWELVQKVIPDYKTLRKNLKNKNKL